MDFDSTEFKNGIKQVVQFLIEAEEGAKDLEKDFSVLEIDLYTQEVKKALSDSTFAIITTLRILRNCKNSTSDILLTP